MFSDVLSIYESSLRVWTTDTREEAEICFPYHDGVIITITAGDGTEDVKVLRGTADDRWLYLALGEHSVVLTAPYGDAVGEAKDRWPMHCEPLPPGTVTRITINHTLPTTAERYSVEVVEPEKPKYTPCLKHLGTVEGVVINQDDVTETDDFEGPTFCIEDWLFSVEGTKQLVEIAQRWLNEHDPPAAKAIEAPKPEKPKFEPISLLHGDTVVSVQDATVVNYQHYRRAVMTPPEARQVAAALTAAANHLDPQEQPATEAVGLPLEMRCGIGYRDKLQVIKGAKERLVFQVNDSYGVVTSPDDESRLRNLLNQRAADGKGCDPN